MKRVIVFVTIAAVAAVVGAIVVGSRTFEGIVADKPYETGIAWDKTRHEKMASGWNAVLTNRDVRVGDAELALRVTDKTGAPLKAAAVAVHLSRPHTTARDRTYRSRETGPGIYSAAVTFPDYGYWDLKTTVSADGKSVSFEERIFINKTGGNP